MPKITQISENKKNKDRVSIYVDDKFVLACHKELVYKKGIQKDQEVDVELLKEIAQEDDYFKAKDIAFRFLEKTMKTESQLREKLLDKEFEPVTIDRVVVLLKEYNLLDDHKYVFQFLTEKLRSRGLKKVTFELHQKGISKEVLNEVLETMDTGSIEEESCFRVAEKKFREIQKKELDHYKQKNKLYAFLAGKGYDYETINSVIRRVMDEAIED
ncbi:MAG: recombination regulator RecX [Clostridiaceae bacterium]